jgi:predicted metal-dependent enzyme (double-stranded beta helix superfamily)
MFGTTRKGISEMSYDLDQFCADCREALGGGDRTRALESIRRKLEMLLGNADFVAHHPGSGSEVGRHELHADPMHDFRVYAHVPKAANIRPPHDHASSWAVYGQAAGHTQMTEWDWDAVAARPVPTRTYRLDPGQAGVVFDVGALHSIDYPDGARFVRVTGTDIDALPARLFDDVDVRREVAEHLGG